MQSKQRKRKNNCPFACVIRKKQNHTSYGSTKSLIIQVQHVRRISSSRYSHIAQRLRLTGHIGIRRCCNGNSCQSTQLFPEGSVYSSNHIICYHNHADTVGRYRYFYCRLLFRPFIPTHDRRMLPASSFPHISEPQTFPEALSMQVVRML